MTFVILAPTLPGPLFAWARATAGERGRQRCTKRLRLSSSSSRRNASSSASASGSELTIGSDAETAEALEQIGAHHKSCPVDAFVCDSKARVVSCPAYMLGPGIKDVAGGIEGLVTEVLRLA